MTDNELSPERPQFFQSFSKITHSLGDAAERENRVYRHVGRLTSSAAGIDEGMSTLLGRLVAPADPALAVRLFGSVGFAVKVKFLKTALPADWPDSKRLLHWIERVESHRNELAHSSVHTAYGITEPTVTTLLSNGKQGIREVDDSQFITWESRAHVLYLTIVGLNMASKGSLLEIPARVTALEVVANGPPAQLAAIDELFPGPAVSDHPGTTN